MSGSRFYVELQSPALQRVARLLYPITNTTEGESVVSHVLEILADCEQHQQETERLLAYVAIMLVDSIASQLPLSSKMFLEADRLRQRLVPPYDAYELNSLRNTVQNFADGLTNLRGIEADTIHAILAPLYTGRAEGIAHSQQQRIAPFDSDVLSKIKKERPSHSSKNKTMDTPVRLDEPGATGREHLRGDNNLMDRTEELEFSQEPIIAGIQKTREFTELLSNELSQLKEAESETSLQARKQVIVSELETLIEEHKELIDYFLQVSQYLSSLKSDSHRLSQELNRVTTLSLTDDLTGLPNRRAFIHRLADEIGRAKRYGLPLSLALVDLDSFKPINDTYGHAAGDAALQAYASDILSGFRQNDLAVRYGGEEFAVIFPNTEMDGALMALRKVRQRAQSAKFIYNQQSLDMPTFSAGLVQYNLGETLESFVRRADRTLYRAKQNGRNRIEYDVERAFGESASS